MSLYRHTLATGDTIEIAAAENDRVASIERPLAVKVPLGRRLGDILGPGALTRTGELGDRRYRRYVWAMIRDIEPPLDATTRIRVFANCTDLSPRTQITDPTYATSMAFFGNEHAQHGGAASAAGASNGTSVCIDLTPSLARMPALHLDYLTVQLLPHCASTETNVSNTRPRRVEIVIL
jgi:hypothetical protein